MKAIPASPTANDNDFGAFTGRPDPSYVAALDVMREKMRITAGFADGPPPPYGLREIMVHEAALQIIAIEKLDAGEPAPTAGGPRS